MIGKKTVREIQQELVKIMQKLPADTASDWLDLEIQESLSAPGAHAESLRLLKEFLEESIPPKPLKSTNRPKGSTRPKKTRRMTASR